MNRDAAAEARAVSGILWRDWDPLGGGTPRNEYESYVPSVHKLLSAGAPRELSLYICACWLMNWTPLACPKIAWRWSLINSWRSA